MCDYIEGLTFGNFMEISDFDKKLADFLIGLDEELKTWRDYVDKNGKRNIPHRIIGYACLKGENVIGIAYFIIPKKYSILNFVRLFLNKKVAKAATVVKKEFHGIGIGTHLIRMRIDLARSKGYKQFIISTDIDNHAIIKVVTNLGYKRIIRYNKSIYWFKDLDEEN